MPRPTTSQQGAPRAATDPTLRAPDSAAASSKPGPSWPLEYVAECLGWSGDLVADVALLGQRVAVIAQIDHDEHRRRCEHGITPVLDHPVLDLLTGLPEGVPVPGDALGSDLSADGARGSGERGESTGDLIERARALGTVKVEQDTVTRTTRRPCRVVGVLRCGGPWLRTIEQISLFAPIAARAVVLSSKAGGDAAELEAASLGIGLVRCRSNDPDPAVRVAPAQTTARLGPGQWLTAETVYAVWRAQVHHSPEPTTP